jgi:osmoprotectant transport system ATP-binding protein
MLLYDAGWVTVLDHDDRFLGVLTPDALFTATRRAQSAGATTPPSGGVSM